MDEQKQLHDSCYLRDKDFADCFRAMKRKERTLPESVSPSIFSNTQGEAKAPDRGQGGGVEASG